jgi:hypothetical protein
VRRILVVLAVAAMVAGCGGDGSGSGNGPAPGGPAPGGSAPGGSASGGALALLDKLPPGETAGAVVVDVAAARTRLGVGDVHTLSDLRAPEPGVQRFQAVLGAGLTFLAAPGRTPLLDVLDLGRIAAVANNNEVNEPAKLVTVFTTDQPWSEIEAKLTGGGYRADGPVLTTANPGRSPELTAIGHSGNLVAVGQRADLVKAVVDGSAPGIHGRAREVLAGLDAPVATVFVRDSGCPRGVAIADHLDGARGTLVVLADQAAVDRFTAPEDTFLGTLRWSPATAGDGKVSADFTYPADSPEHQPMTVLRNAILNGMYRC